MIKCIVVQLYHKDQIYEFEQEATEAIISGGSKGLAAYGEKCTEDLSQIVELVRGKLTKLERASCSALIVIDVHARDVVVAMSEQGVENVTDFNWESQLRYASVHIGTIIGVGISGQWLSLSNTCFVSRYYWEYAEAPPSGIPTCDTLVVKMINGVTSLQTMCCDVSIVSSHNGFCSFHAVWIRIFGELREVGYYTSD